MEMKFTGKLHSQFQRFLKALYRIFPFSRQDIFFAALIIISTCISGGSSSSCADTTDIPATYAVNINTTEKILLITTRLIYPIQIVCMQ